MLHFFPNTTTNQEYNVVYVSMVKEEFNCIISTASLWSATKTLETFCLYA